MADKFIIPNNVLSQFFNVDNVVNVRRFGHGLVNESYIVEFPTCKYKLVKISEDVYNSPLAVVSNMMSVNSVLRSALIYEGIDPRMGVGTTVLTIDEQPVAIVEDQFWKCRRYIENVDVYRHTTDPEIARSWGTFLGIFHVTTMQIHTRTLIDTINHFHDTQYRFNYLVDVIKIDKFGRVQDCVEEIAYLMEHGTNLDLINEAIRNKDIPRRVCHNDPKLLNFLFTKNSKSCCGIVGMENVMKGSLLFDFGDAVRDLTLNPKTIDEVKNSDVLDLSCFDAFCEGYLEKVKEILKPLEARYLFEAIRILSLELAIRFLTDFIEGDIYFNVKYENEQSNKNLLRCQTIIEYVDVLMNHRTEIIDKINEILRRLDYSNEYYCE